MVQALGSAPCPAQRGPQPQLPSGLGISSPLATSTASGQCARPGRQPGAAAPPPARAPASRGRSLPQGLQQCGVESPAASPPPAGYKGFNRLPAPPASSAHGEAAQAGHGPMGSFQAWRVGHRCGRPHGFKRIQLAVPGGEQAGTRRPSRPRWCRRASCCLDAEFEGQGCALAFGDHRCQAGPPARCCARATGRPGTTRGRPWACQDPPDQRRKRSRDLPDAIARPPLARWEDSPMNTPRAHCCPLPAAGGRLLPGSRMSRHSQALQPPTCWPGRRCRRV